MRSHYFCLAAAAPRLMRIRSYQCSSFRQGSAEDVSRSATGMSGAEKMEVEDGPPPLVSHDEDGNAFWDEALTKEDRDASTRTSWTFGSFPHVLQPDSSSIQSES